MYKKHFPSLSAVVDYINTTPKVWKTDASTNGDKEHSWDLSAGYQGALDMAFNGWREGARNVQQGLEILRPTASAYFKRYHVTGQRVSIGRYLVGNPLCMVDRKPKQSAKPAIRLAVSVCCSAFVRADCFSNFGLAIASYAEQLEQAGYKVEVIAAIPNAYKNGQVQESIFSWVVKGLHDRLDFSDLAFSIGHPACFRRLGFALIERLPCAASWSYGKVRKILPGDLPHDNVILLNGINQVNDKATTPEDALAYVAEVISEAMKTQGLV
jgi:hypothetical protein